MTISLAYSNESMRDMQQDALERLYEMQRRSKTAVGEVPAESQPVSASAPAISRNISPPQGQDNPISGLLSNLGGDKILLLLLAYLLYKNKSDYKLLLAIGYLLL